MTDDELETIAQLAAAAAELEAQAEQARHDRDAAIVEVLDAGRAPFAAVARAAGLSKGRIDQIFNRGG